MCTGWLRRLFSLGCSSFFTNRVGDTTESIRLKAFRARAKGLGCTQQPSSWTVVDARLQRMTVLALSGLSGPATEALKASCCRKRCFTKFSDESSLCETQRLRELTLHAPVLPFPVIEWSIDDDERVADLTMKVAAMQPYLYGDGGEADIKATVEQKYPNCSSIHSLKNMQVPEGSPSRMLRSRNFTSSLSLLDYSTEYKTCPRASAA